MKATHESPVDFRSARQRAETSARALASAVRAALGDALQESGGARSCGRALGLERTLGWKVWNLAYATDLAAVLRVLPGRRGWTQVMTALDNLGVDAPRIKAVRAAADQMLEVVRELRRQPSLLRAVGAGALDSRVERERTIAARRKASRANERVYGLHVAAAIVTAMLVPERGSRRLSLACAASFARVTRSRPGMPWPIYARLATLDTRTGSRALGTPVDRGSPLEPLVSDLSSRGLAEGSLHVGERDGCVFLEIADLPADGDAAHLISVAEYVHGATRANARDADPVHLRYGILVPTDLLVFNVLTHRSLTLSRTPSPWMCGTPLSIRSLAGWDEEARLPLESECECVPVADLDKRAGAAGLRHGELLRRTAAALSTDLDAFVAYRAQVAFPPLFSSVFASFELAPAASVGRTRRREHRVR